MAQEIRIELATYLKDAGIKATDSQVKALSERVKRYNEQAKHGTDSLANSLGRLPGGLGKIQQAFGGLTAKALSFIGALKLGIDIGNWIQDKCIRPLFGLKEPIEELKKQNRALAAEAKRALEEWKQAYTEWERTWDREITGAKKARNAIEDTAAAYLKMQKAKEAAFDANDEASILKLEKQKADVMFWQYDPKRNKDIAKMWQENGWARTPEQAAYNGVQMDILIAEEKGKQRLAKFDREAATADEAAKANLKAINAMERERTKLYEKRGELEKKLRYASSMAFVDKYGFEEANDEEERLEAKVDRINAEIDAKTREITRAREDRKAWEEEVKARPQQRANLIARIEKDNIDAMDAHDNFLRDLEAAQVKAREEEARDRQKMIDDEAAERKRMERELTQQRIADMRQELAERTALENEARSRQANANSGLAQAWGWYKDQNSMQRAIDEAKAQKEAEKKWEADFRSLKFRRDWRTIEFGKLSAAEESVRQVAFAKEEKAAADRAVLETAENTRNLAEKLDELLAMK